jgi:hypothetical protein
MSHLRLGFVLAALIVGACATDNGQGVFGEQFGPNDHVDGGGEASPAEGGGPPPPPVDGGTDAPSDGPSSCPEHGTVAVLAGNDSALTGALAVDGAGFSGAAVVGGASKSLPALVAFGGGFLGVTRGPNDSLQSLVTTTAFGPPSNIVGSGVKDSPALAVAGTSAHVVWLGGPGANQDFAHGVNTGAGWDSATDPVGSPASFGSSAGAIAGAGTDIVFAQAGNDNGLYVRTWSGSWSAAQGVNGAGAFTAASPALAPVSGTYDVVAVFAEKDSKKIEWTARSGATWSAPAVTNDLSTTAQPLALSRAGASSLVVAFAGEDGKGYASIGTISGASITWTAAAPLVSGGVSVDSRPAVAKGVCGDDAIAAFASGGVVKVVRLRGGTWSAPEVVSGTSGSRVAIATR